MDLVDFSLGLLYIVTLNCGNDVLVWAVVELDYPLHITICQMILFFVAFSK